MLSDVQYEYFKQNIVQNTYINSHYYESFLCSKNLPLILLYIGELIFSNYLCQFVTAFNMSHENIRLED